MSRLMIMLCGIGLLLIACSEPAQPPGPSAIELKIKDHSASLLDWHQASVREKQLFGRLYTEAHLGSFDQNKSADIIEFLDSSVQELTASMRSQGVPGESIDQIMSGQEIWLMSAAGARLMGWPAAKGDIRPASDRQKDMIE